MFSRHGLWLNKSKRKESNMTLREWFSHHVWGPFIEDTRRENATGDPVAGYASVRARDWLSADCTYRCLKHYYTAPDMASGWYPVHESDADLIGLVCQGCETP